MVSGYMLRHADETFKVCRADAQRILQVAKDAFTRSGANASLDDIAKETRVGPGTLALPYSQCTPGGSLSDRGKKLAAAERRFAEFIPPMEALRARMLLFVVYIATKKIIKSGEVRRHLDPIDLLRALVGVSYMATSPDR
jgi:hypothetical protein